MNRFLILIALLPGVSLASYPALMLALGADLVEMAMVVRLEHSLFQRIVPEVSATGIEGSWQAVLEFSYDAGKRFRP